MKKKSVLAWIWDFVSLHKIYFVLSLIFAFASVLPAAVSLGRSGLDWLLGIPWYFYHAVAYSYF